jgi:hypothetical protein
VDVRELIEATRAGQDPRRLLEQVATLRNVEEVVRKLRRLVKGARQGWDLDKTGTHRERNVGAEGPYYIVRCDFDLHQLNPYVDGAHSWELAQDESERGRGHWYLIYEGGEGDLAEWAPAKPFARGAHGYEAGLASHKATTDQVAKLAFNTLKRAGMLVMCEAPEPDTRERDIPSAAQRNRGGIPRVGYRRR